LLAAFGKAFKTPDLRKKIIFTLSIMALFRLGSVIPTPGVSYVNVQECLATANTGGLFGLINLFSGGALLQLSVFCSRHHALHHQLNHRSVVNSGNPSI